MSTKRVTLDDALEGLRKAVAEKGDEYQYGQHHDNCVYAAYVDGEAQPACIVGYALVYLGVPAEYLVDSGWNGSNITPALSAGVLDDLGYKFDLEAMEAFRLAQLVQDDSYGPRPSTTWGAALAKAERFADRNGGAA